MEINLELFNRFFNKNCTEQELDKVLSWLKDPSNDDQIKTMLYKYQENLEPSKSIDYERLLDKVHHRINLETSHTQKIDNAKAHPRRFMSQLYKHFSRVAAILILPLVFVGLMYFLNDVRFFPDDKVITYSTVESVPGSKTKHELPDGSTVWLNGGTKITYPLNFSEKERLISLSGEAFFDVEKDKNRPFIVSTSNLNIKALGTSFNVKAYADDNAVEATLVTGIISIEGDGFQLGKKNKITLTPDQKVLFYKNDNSDVSTLNGNSVNNISSGRIEKLAPKKVVISSKIDTDIDIAWVNGKLILQNTPLDEVAKKLSRWYNADIVLEDPQLSKISYTATFTDETLLQVLDLLKLATPIDYTYSGRQQLDDKSFTKRKVRISIRKG